MLRLSHARRAFELLMAVRDGNRYSSLEPKPGPSDSSVVHFKRVPDPTTGETLYVPTDENETAKEGER